MGRLVAQTPFIPFGTENCQAMTNSLRGVTPGGLLPYLTFRIQIIYSEALEAFIQYGTTRQPGRQDANTSCLGMNRV